MAENITVAVRVRPLLNNEKSSDWYTKDNSIWQSNDNRSNPKIYVLDQIFCPGDSTKTVYEQIVRPLIHNFVEGFNCTIFAYGQTGSGKTHTVHGDGGKNGIIGLTLEDVFQHIDESLDREFLLRIMYMEIYNEEINDLLNPKDGKNLQIRDGPGGVQQVLGVSEKIVADAEGVFELITQGDKNKHIASTKMNERSSRSHTIFRMVLESKDMNSEEGQAAILVSQLNLVDLAGSERTSKAGTEGTRLKEGSNINRSLLALGMVIKALSENAQATGGHVPYRDSKLTRILQPSLGGNAKTAIVCNITTAISHLEESHNTLRFATQAKQVMNMAMKNEVLSDAALLRRQAKEIELLKIQLEQNHAITSSELKAEISHLRSQLLQGEKQTEILHIRLQEETDRREKAEREALWQKQLVEQQRKQDSALGKRQTRRETWCPGGNTIPNGGQLNVKSSPVLTIKQDLQDAAEAFGTFLPTTCKSSPQILPPAKKLRISLDSNHNDSLSTEICDQYDTQNLFTQNQCLEKQLCILRQQLQRTQNNAALELQALKEELNNSDQTVEQIRRENEQVVQEYNSLSKNFANLKFQLQNRNNVVQRQDNIISNLRNQCAIYSAQQKAFECHIFQEIVRNHEIQQLVLQLRQQRRQFEVVHKCRCDLESKIFQLEDQLNNSNEQVAVLQSDLNKQKQSYMAQLQQTEELQKVGNREREELTARSIYLQKCVEQLQVENSYLQGIKEKKVTKDVAAQYDYQLQEGLPEMKYLQAEQPLVGRDICLGAKFAFLDKTIERYVHMRVRQDGGVKEQLLFSQHKQELTENYKFSEKLLQQAEIKIIDLQSQLKQCQEELILSQKEFQLLQSSQKELTDNQKATNQQLQNIESIRQGLQTQLISCQQEIKSYQQELNLLLQCKEEQANNLKLANKQLQDVEAQRVDIQKQFFSCQQELKSNQNKLQIAETQQAKLQIRLSQHQQEIQLQQDLSLDAPEKVNCFASVQSEKDLFGENQFLKRELQDIRHRYDELVRVQEAYTKQQLLEDNSSVKKQLQQALFRLQEAKYSLENDKKELKDVRRENRRLSLQVSHIPQIDGQIQQLLFRNISLELKLEEVEEQSRKLQEENSRQLVDAQKKFQEADLVRRKCVMKYKGMEYRLQKDFQAIIDGIKDASKNGRQVVEQVQLRNILERVTYTASLEYAAQYYQRKCQRIESELDDVKAQLQQNVMSSQQQQNMQDYCNKPLGILTENSNKVNKSDN